MPRPLGMPGHLFAALDNMQVIVSVMIFMMLMMMFDWFRHDDIVVATSIGGER